MKKREKSLHEQFGRDALPILSNTIRDAAESAPLPERFMVKNNPDGSPSVIILDTTTGRSARVPLFGYRVVREVLDELFKD